MKIHIEGKSILVKSLIIFILINGTCIFFLRGSIFTFIVLALSIILYAMTLNFYKKPSREYEGDLLGLINAPTDGKVVAIEKVFEDKFLHEECIQISIFMSFFNAHSNWMPVTGKIVHLSHVEGNFYAAYLPKSSTENEHTNIVIETPDNHLILTRQIAGAVARRIVTYVKEGEKLHIGDPLGFIKLGSRMDVFVPIDSEILVKINDEVRSNKTFLAYLPKERKPKNSIN